MRLFPKLALVVSSLLIVAITALSTLYYWNEERHIRQAAQAHQQELLQNLVLIAQDAFFSNDELLLATYAHRLQRWNPEVVSASVVDPTGHIRAHSEPRNIGKAYDAVTPSSALVLSQAVRYGRQYIGTASVMFSQKLLDAALDARRAELKKRVLSVAASALFLGLVASLLVALSWTRPIRRLELAFEQIGRGRWNVDLGSLGHRRDEIGYLARGCEAMASRLAELDQLKDDFVASVSHEFRSPLAAIESYLDRIQILHERGDAPDTWFGHLKPIRQSCDRLERFVDDLLDVAYCETGKLALDRKTTDLAALSRDVLALFEFKIRAKSLACDLDAPPGLPQPLIDPERIRQVITNLVSNAIKFTPEGGRILVSVASADFGKSLRLSVRDSGIGIAAADQERIFNKFEQVKAARAQVKGAKGSGLGLAISRALVEMHGGEIGVESTPGQGSVFFILLPVGTSARSKTPALI